MRGGSLTADDPGAGEPVPNPEPNPAPAPQPVPPPQSTTKDAEPEPEPEQEDLWERLELALAAHDADGDPSGMVKANSILYEAQAAAAAYNLHNPARRQGERRTPLGASDEGAEASQRRANEQLMALGVPASKLPKLEPEPGVGRNPMAEALATESKPGPE
tara:strand:+ start:441 stop:923 length:483 start_codon:yes stop_codon:yes gene_type:complete